MINIEDKPKILIWDIENTPILAYVWGLYEQNVVDVVRNWNLLSVSFRWYGENKTYSYALPDFKESFDKDKFDDFELTLKIRGLLDEADIIVAHNGDQFDIRKVMARIAYHNIPPPSPFVSIDTKKAAKKYFAFDSNSLKDLAKFLKVGEKMETGGFSLWKGCMAGDEDSWKKMVKYNKMDVVVLEKIYERLRPYISNHPNVSDVELLSCKQCGSLNVQRRGFIVTKSGSRYQRVACQDCGGWCQERLLLDKSISK